MVSAAAADDWKFERVAGPFPGNMGGVAWDGQAVLFSLPEAMVIKRFDPSTGATSDWRKYTGRANGLAVARDGSVYAAQEGGRRVIQYLPDGSATVTGLRLAGAVHNHPCDLVVDSRGRVWFSDPHHGVHAFGPQVFPPLDHASVLRLERDERRAWQIRRVTFDTTVPRAVLLSPDEKTLYVSEGDTTRSALRELRAYPVRADGTVGPYELLHAFGRDHRGAHRGIEGLCLDSDGRVIACGGSRDAGPGPMIYVFEPAGRLAFTQVFPGDAPVRCAFGGAALDELYVSSADGCLYRARAVSLRGFAR
ncbi:MAG: SMP-30/gluconolactonase/LRE family protein, partial [Ramlibacter sp.]